MEQRGIPVRLAQGTEASATATPAGVENRQILYRVLFDRPATARSLAAVAGACRFVNVRQKAGLNRVILATGWSGLRAMLAYKAPRLVAVDPRHTSQTCAACGEIHATSRQSQANFHCVACGHADHADLNAARRSGVGDWRCCTARGVRTQRPRRPVKWIGDWRRESSTYRYEPQTNSTRTSLHVVRQETSVPDTGARYQPRGVDQCPC